LRRSFRHQILALTARLRYHDLSYVRALAAGSLGFLFRHAGSVALRAGVRTLAAEAAARPSSRTQVCAPVLLDFLQAFAVFFTDPTCRCGACWAMGPYASWDLTPPLIQRVSKVGFDRMQPAGELLATAVKGVDHGLHSRAADVWRLLLRPDLLRSEDFKGAKVSFKRPHDRG